MSATVLPLRRQDQLVAKQVGDETVIYDLTNDQVINLPAATAKVWAACDGATDIDSIAAFAGLDAKTAGALLGELADRGLLVDAKTKSGLTRRQLIVRGAAVGAGVAALPLIQALPAAAVSECLTIGGQTPSGETVCLSDALLALAADDTATPLQDCGFSFFGKQNDNQTFPGGTQDKLLDYIGNGTFEGKEQGITDTFVGPVQNVGGQDLVRVKITQETNIVFKYTLPAGGSPLQCVQYTICYPDATAEASITVQFWDENEVNTETITVAPGDACVTDITPWQVNNPGDIGYISFLQENAGGGNPEPGEIFVDICPVPCP